MEFKIFLNLLCTVLTGRRIVAILVSLHAVTEAVALDIKSGKILSHGRHAAEGRNAVKNSVKSVFSEDPYNDGGLAGIKSDGLIARFKKRTANVL